MATKEKRHLEQADLGGNGDGADPRARKGSYALVMALYGAATGSFLAWRKASGRGLPDRLGAGDLTMIGVATHKTSRLIAKDKVATPIRAPFTRFEDEADLPVEVSESPRGSGLRRTIGELISCPYCLDMWTATTYAAGLVAAPRVTRFIAGVMSAVTIADALQLAYKAGQEQL